MEPILAGTPNPNHYQPGTQGFVALKKHLETRVPMFLNMHANDREIQECGVGGAIILLTLAYFKNLGFENGVSTDLMETLYDNILAEAGEL